MSGTLTAGHRRRRHDTPSDTDRIRKDEEGERSPKDSNGDFLLLCVVWREVAKELEPRG